MKKPHAPFFSLSSPVPPRFEAAFQPSFPVSPQRSLRGGARPRRGNPFPLKPPLCKGRCPAGAEGLSQGSIHKKPSIPDGFSISLRPTRKGKGIRENPSGVYPSYFIKDTKKQHPFGCGFPVQRPLRPMQPIRSCRPRRPTQTEKPPQRVALQMRTLFSHPPYTLLGKERV